MKMSVIDAPGGVSYWKLTKIPVKIPIRLIMIPRTIVLEKLLATLIAVADGITIRADTNKAPTIGIIILMVTPVNTEKIIDIKRTGRPLVWAVASS